MQELFKARCRYVSALNSLSVTSQVDAELRRQFETAIEAIDRKMTTLGMKTDAADSKDAGAAT